MKPRIRLAFCDFWPKFDPADNYFTRLLERRFTIELCEQPDFLIYSCFGRRHRQISGAREFFTLAKIGGPIFGFAIGRSRSIILHDPRHFRLPLYALYGDPASLIKQPIDAEQGFGGENAVLQFCVLQSAVSHEKSFFQVVIEVQARRFRRAALQQFGRAGGRQSWRLVRASKFTIAFENDSRPGYTTEKLSQPMEAAERANLLGQPAACIWISIRAVLSTCMIFRIWKRRCGMWQKSIE